MKGKENVVFKAFMTVHSELTFVTIFGEDVNDQLTQSVLISVRNAITKETLVIKCNWVMQKVVF